MRILLIGSGFVAPHHIAGWRRSGCDVVGIASPDDGGGRSLCDRFGITEQFPDIDTALPALRPDVVDVCSPVGFHVAHVTMAARHGAHIICQKPLAETLDDAIAAADEVHRSGVRLMVHENFRFRPWYRAVKQAIDAGRIGAAFYLRSDLRFPGTVPTSRNVVPWSLARQPFFRDLPRFIVLESMIHQVDVARFLLGEPHSVYAVLRNISGEVAGEDLATLVLEFAQAHAVLERSYAALGADDPPAASEELLVEGRGGTIRVSRAGEVTLLSDGMSGRRTEQIPVDRDGAYEASYAATIAHFVACLKTGLPFETRPEDNLRTLDATLAAYTSAERHAPVSLPTKPLADFLRQGAAAS